jgi:hypothetical protein
LKPDLKEPKSNGRSPGRPPGVGNKKGLESGKVITAIKKASAAAVVIGEMNDVVSKMNDYQKVLFESIMSGDDDLIATLKCGQTRWFTGITKIVYLEGHIALETDKLNLSNVKDLEKESYERLLRVCGSQVRHKLGTSDYREYTLPIKEYIQRFAPLALGTIVDIAQNSKDDTRLKAAKDLLDRAGEGAREPEKDVIIPVQVNIMLTSDSGKVTSYNE